MPALIYHLEAWRIELLFSLYGAEMCKAWSSPNSWAIIALWVDALIENLYCPMSWPLLDSYLYFILNHTYNVPQKPSFVKDFFQLFSLFLCRKVLISKGLRAVGPGVAS